MKHGMQPNFSLLLLIACLICVGSLGAQASRSSILPYRTVNAFRTSPSDENRRLFFDHFGMLWIGTSSGLKSYDGYDLRTIKSTAANPSVLPHNTVLSITEDRRHNLWIGTRNGVVRMDEDRMSFTTYPPYPRDYRIVTTLYTSPVVRFGWAIVEAFYAMMFSTIVLCSIMTGMRILLIYKEGVIEC